MVKMGFFAKVFVNSRVQWLLHKWFGISKLLDTTMADQAEKILELGCGIGITTTFIAKRFREAKITALDYDESQIEIAKRRKHNNNVEFIAGDAANLRFKDNTFDVVFEVLAFHHIPEYEKAIKEAHRTLKKGGRFLIMDVGLKSIGLWGKLIFFEPVKFSRKEFVEKLEKTKFKIKWTKGNLFFWIEAIKVS